VSVDTTHPGPPWPPQPRDPDGFLPLHPLEFRILLVLWKEKAHGYRIVKSIEDVDGGLEPHLPANLYRRIRDLLARA
jgi:DNA-binding PadR family transcriptional regulator